MSQGLPVVVGIVVIALVFAAIYFISDRMRKKRIARLESYAEAHGWMYAADDSSLLGLSDGAPFGRGDRRTAQDAFNGTIDGHEFASFQYSYQETSGSGDDRTTTTYEFMVTCIVTPPSSYRLEIGPEGMLSGFFGALGFSDLELESDEFNKKFKIKASPERFAYDVLNPRTMERMLADQRYSQPLRFENGRLLTWRTGRLDELKISGDVKYLIDTLEPVPTYAWEQR
ncbi:DUF3137 domain-containing protein [Mycobacterium sp. NPDC050853]|uniref:DUF3137 domain-containing protein n=1 Tax=Mycobacteriaceae TaxID=1762 RepID=UPI0015DD737F|nr:DUF3137 domain-containing protein [Mycobacteroides sp. LB1]